MTKKTEKKIEEVKELLNKVVILCGKSEDDFLSDAKETCQAFLKQNEEVDEDEDQYNASDSYYDSNC